VLKSKIIFEIFTRHAATQININPLCFLVAFLIVGLVWQFPARQIMPSAKVVDEVNSLLL
jgi:hypothetical protein